MMDLGTLIGLLVGFGCAIVVGPMLEGLHMQSIIQPTAALIVFGGTLGATVLGYAPTVGILGAVLGLIHVMQQVNDPSKLGSGIAVAFVATVYGVGSANLLFLPIANKLKLRSAARSRVDLMILDGVLGIVEGLNHHLLRERLTVYLLEDGVTSAKPASAEAA